MVEAPRLEPERSLDRLDDLATAGMADEAADVAALHGLGLQDRIDGRPEALVREGGDRLIEDHAEADRIDLPPHDVEGIGPGMVARSRRCAPRRPVAR